MRTVQECLQRLQERVYHLHLDVPKPPLPQRVMRPVSGIQGSEEALDAVEERLRDLLLMIRGGTLGTSDLGRIARTFDYLKRAAQKGATEG